MKPSKRFRWKSGLFVAAILLVVGGCVQETNVNGEHISQYELWVPFSVLLVGLVGISMGLVLRKKIPRLGWCLVVVGPVVAIIFAPSLFRDRVVVTSDHFHVQTGIWGLTAVHSLKFADIEEIQITSEKTTNRGRERTNYFLNCYKKTGGSCKVPVNNPVTEASAAAIMREAKAHAIPIRDETRGK